MAQIESRRPVQIRRCTPVERGRRAHRPISRPSASGAFTTTIDLKEKHSAQQCPRGTELQHRELWEELISLNARLHIRWRWLRGHNGHPVHDRGDALAYQAARSLRVQERTAA